MKKYIFLFFFIAMTSAFADVKFKNTFEMTLNCNNSFISTQDMITGESFNTRITEDAGGKKTSESDGSNIIKEVLKPFIEVLRAFLKQIYIILEKLFDTILKK